MGLEALPGRDAVGGVAVPEAGLWAVGKCARILTVPSCSVYRRAAPAFQSTLPVWGATCRRSASSASSTNFNPRSPCGERPGGAGHDPDDAGFQSTLPVWGATHVAELPIEPVDISIHAPRVGSDETNNPTAQCRVISIHAPRVGSDDEHCNFINVQHISIHAPRVGSDSQRMTETDCS